MKRFVVLSASLVLVSGCFLEQQEPKPNSLNSAPFIGVVTAEDVEASDKKYGVVNASFAQLRQRGAVMRSVVEEDREYCKTSKEKVSETESETRADAQFARIAVGQVGFGVSGSGELFPLEMDENGRYSRKYPAGMAAGLYEFVAQGTQGLQGFRVQLMMPPRIEEMKLGEHGIDTPGLVIDTAEPLSLSWKATAAENDGDMVLFELSSKDAEYVGVINCAVKESELPVENGVVTWDIDSTYLVDLPVGVTSRMLFIRANVRAAKLERSEIQTQGMRSKLVLLPIE